MSHWLNVYCSCISLKFISQDLYQVIHNHLQLQLQWDLMHQASIDICICVHIPSFPTDTQLEAQINLKKKI